MGIGGDELPPQYGAKGLQGFGLKTSVSGAEGIRTRSGGRRIATLGIVLQLHLLLQLSRLGPHLLNWVLRMTGRSFRVSQPYPDPNLPF